MSVHLLFPNGLTPRARALVVLGPPLARAYGVRKAAELMREEGVPLPIALLVLVHRLPDRTRA